MKAPFIPIISSKEDTQHFDRVNIISYVKEFTESQVESFKDGIMAGSSENGKDYHDFSFQSSMKE